MLVDLLLLLSLLYSIQIILFAIAATRAQYPVDRRPLPPVSIIIAARNEEANIARCLESMAALDYPRDLLQVIVVDDHSSDTTPQIIRGFTAAHPNVELIEAVPGRDTLRGKTNAVAQGMDAARGEIVLFTDADCAVPKGWVKETVKYYTSEEIGIVGGFTSLDSGNWFESMQAIDWFVLFSVAAATIRLGYPVTAVGNNLSVRRKAYEEVGGYRNIPFSVTEDYALFHAITSRTHYRARIPIDPATVVRSGACENLRDLYHQKKRWFTGGRDMDIKSMLIFGVAYLLNLSLIVASVTGWAPVVTAAWACKLIPDFFLTLPAISKFRRWKLLLAFPAYELYYVLYVLIYPPLVLFAPDVVWKERAFND
jgi:cellulose synthase/poly-beta-1,6-N-acetylglucosamine synthase-like glycosyltransferase